MILLTALGGGGTAVQAAVGCLAQCDPADADGGGAIADVARAEHEILAPDPADAFRCRHGVGGVLVPPGALASVPTPVRFGAFVGGFLIYLLVRRSMLAGVIGAELVLLGGKWWFM